jgi:cation transport ATPase
VTSRTRDAQDDEAENEDSSENPWSNAVQFLCALLGVLLVGITPNPPITARDWVQMLVGATLTAVMTTAAVRTRLLRLVGNAWPAVKKRRWQDWVLVVAALLLAVAIVSGSASSRT